jgi:hypothetical protein
MCATVSWGAHESFMHPIFVLKNGCDTYDAGDTPNNVSDPPVAPLVNIEELYRASNVWVFKLWMVWSLTGSQEPLKLMMTTLLES